MKNLNLEAMQLNDLSDNGYSKIEIVSISDIIAYKDNKKYYFEVKKTSNRYFGAAKQNVALENPNTTL